MADVYNSKLAKLIGKINGYGLYAITTSKNCCRYSCSEISVDRKWRAHEETHKEQFRKLGWIKFVLSYMIESIKYGYDGNRFELEARGDK